MGALIFVSCGDTKKKSFGLDLPLIRKDAAVKKDTEASKDTEVKKDLEVKKDGEPYDASLLPRLLQHQASDKRFALAGDQDVTVEFSWQEEPGQADGTALSIRAPHQQTPLFQIFSRAHRPFARSGLEVSSLQEGVRYRMTVRQLDSGALDVRVIRASTGALVVRWSAPLSPDLLLVVGSSIEALSVQQGTATAPLLASL